MIFGGDTLADNPSAAPSGLPADVTLHLQISTDLDTWTTLLTYTGGITFSNSSESRFYRFSGNFAV